MRFMQLPGIVIYKHNYTVIHVHLSLNTQYSGVKYIRLKVSWK